MSRSLKQRQVWLVNYWNERYPEGTPVTVTRDNGEQFETVTRSEAGYAENDMAVIMVKGIAGYYRLDRVRAQQSVHPTLLESAPLEALSTLEHSATSQTDQTPQQRGLRKPLAGTLLER